MLRELSAYFRPTDLADALTLLAQPGNVAALAGGTELLARKDATIHAVVDLQGLGLDYLRRADDGLHIGAMTRLQTLVSDTLARTSLDDSLLHSVVNSAAYTERCAATIGGTIASAPAWNDILPALLVTDAALGLQRTGVQQTVGMDLLLSNRAALLSKGTLITEVLIPSQPGGARFAGHRVSRTPADRAIVNLAVRTVIQDGLVRDVRVAAGGVAAHALRLASVETALKGGDIRRVDTVDRAAAEAMRTLDPPSDHIASGSYRREMIGVLLRRTLNEVANRYA